MSNDTVELELPSRDSESVRDAGDPWIEERKRFDEERQRLRREITALKQENREREQQMLIARERDKERLYQETVQLTGELFTLRRQLAEQTKAQEQTKAEETMAQPELQRLQELLAESQRCADGLRQEVAELKRERAALQTRLQELEGTSARESPPSAPPAAAEPARAKKSPPSPAAKAAPAPASAPVAKAPPAPAVAKAKTSPAPAAAPVAKQKARKAEAKPVEPPPPPAAEMTEDEQPEVVENVPDRKNSFHRSGNPIPVLIAATAEDDEALSGWVVERSMGGMTLLLDQELPLGTQVRVRNARKTCTRSAWNVVTVKKVEGVGSSFKLICRFTQQPSWEAIQQFW